MRVAYVVSRFPSTTETFIAREMAALQRRGVDIQLFALRRQRRAVIHPESSTFQSHVPRFSDLMRGQAYWIRRSPRRLVRVWREALAGNARSVGFLGRAALVVPMAAWFARLATESGAQHVHAHWATHAALGAWVMHRLTGLPFSVTAHAHDIFVDTSMLGRKLDDAAFVAVISDFNARYLVERFPREVEGKVSVVRCGVTPEHFAEGPAGASSDFRVICVASLEDYKGHAVLLNALSELQHDGIAVRTVLVGDGPLRGALTGRAAQLGIADRVEFTGALTSDAVAARLRTADAFVLPSIVTETGKMEGIPVALMEAGAARLPLVASAISGIPELVIDGQTGLLVPPGDAQALAAALRHLALSPPLRERLGRSAQQHVLAEFTIDAAAERLLGLFTGVRESVPHG